MTSDQALHETVIVQRVLGGERDAYALLVERYNIPLFRYLSRMTDQPADAEELAQEAFLRAYLSLASYDPSYRFSTWLFRIATNLAINRIKAASKIVSLDEMRDRREERDEPPLELTDPSTDNQPHLAAERSELVRLIQKCIQELPPDYRAVVALRHIAELSYAEISDSIGLPLNTVRTRLHRGRERLGACLEARLPKEQRS
jgi:RNA polymerase sigma-70 factor (ECF subfamily)